MSRNTHPHTASKLSIGTPRQARLLINIAYQPESAHNLRTIVGSENIWEEVRQLRNTGWRIQTTQRSMRDRDNRKIRAGFYQLERSQISAALEAIHIFNLKQERAKNSKN